MNRRHKHVSGLLALALTLGAVGALQVLPSGQRAQAAAEGQGTGQDKRTLAEQLVHDLREGSLAIEGDHAAVSALILKRNIPIPSKYIESLMWTPNAFGAGPACVICHSSNDPYARAIIKTGLMPTTEAAAELFATAIMAFPIRARLKNKKSTNIVTTLAKRQKSSCGEMPAPKM